MKSLLTLALISITQVSFAEISLSSWQNLNTKINGSIAQKQTPVLMLKTFSPASYAPVVSKPKQEDALKIEINTKVEQKSGSTLETFVKSTGGMVGLGTFLGSVSYLISDEKWAVKPFLKHAGFGALIGLVVGAGCALMAL